MSVREHGQVGDTRHTATHGTPETLPANQAWHFALKGSPRHYDDVRNIINRSNEAIVYFGEALTYERGAAVAIWRIHARGLDWLKPLYDWWAEQERIEPIEFTFHLYFPSDNKYSVLDLRDSSPNEVAWQIRSRAPIVER